MNRQMLRRMVLKEMHDQMHHGHHDHGNKPGKVFHHNGPEAESDMIHSNLWSMKMKACDLYDMIGDSDDLPEWVQEKIAVAGFMIDSVFDYLNYEYNGSSEAGHEHGDRVAAFETGYDYAADDMRGKDTDAVVAYINEKAARRRRRKNEG